MKDPRRWLLLIGVAVTAAIALYSFSRPNVKAPGAACLTTPECLSDEQCLVTPASDGFATLGRCVKSCDTTPCAGAAACVEAATAEGHLVAADSPKAGSTRVKVCVEKQGP